MWTRWAHSMLTEPEQQTVAYLSPGTSPRCSMLVARIHWSFSGVVRNGYARVPHRGATEENHTANASPKAATTSPNDVREMRKTVNGMRKMMVANGAICLLST